MRVVRAGSFVVVLGLGRVAALVYRFLEFDFGEEMLSEGAFRFVVFEVDGDGVSPSDTSTSSEEYLGIVHLGQY